VVSTKAGTVTVTGGGATVTVPVGTQTTVLTGSLPGAPQPMSYEEQIRWGMASGAGLDVALPAAGIPATMTYTGYFFYNYDWSPDGQYFAVNYYDMGKGEYDTYFYDIWADSLLPSIVPPGTSGVFFNPADGNLAYQSFSADYTYTQLCTMGTDGTPGSCFGGDATYGWPFWSPDGEWIAFYSDRDMASNAGLDLYRVRPDGSDMTPLTSDGAGWYNIRQAWSPDGSQIAYVHTDDYMGPGDVWVMNADGTDAHMLFEDIYGNGYHHLTWSPDGSSLAVPAAEGGLYVVPVDGSDPWIVPGTEGWDCWLPSWSPTDDGWPLFFHGYDPSGGLSGLWYTSGAADGPLYITPAEWGPAWSPDGSHAAIGFADYTGDMPSGTIYIFQTYPDFWP